MSGDFWKAYLGFDRGDFGGNSPNFVRWRGKICFSNSEKSFILSTAGNEIKGCGMTGQPLKKELGGTVVLEEKIKVLMQENEQLKKDNEAMIQIIAQMKVTLNRLISRYMVYSEQSAEE